MSRNTSVKKPGGKSTADRVKNLCMAGMFTALAYLVMFVFHIRVSFLTFEFKDAVMTIGAMVCGPVYAVAMSVITSLVEMLTISSTGVYGFIMNVVASIAFTLPASLIYHYKRNIYGALIGTVTSIFTMTGLMLVANLIVTPLYVNMDTAAVAQMIPTLLLPFNLTKAALNAGTVLLLYKPVSTALKKIGLKNAYGETNKQYSLRTALIVTLIAAVLIAASIVVFILVLGGNITVGK